MSEVTVKRGKYAGKRGTFMYWTKPHPLSSKRRAGIRLQTGHGHITLLINEDGFEAAA